MISDIANKFQQTTKFNLYSYFTDYADFMQNQYQAVYSYYAGKSETIDAVYIDNLHSLLSRGNDLLKIFATFGTKFGNVGYWELQNYCQDLYDTIQKVTVLPKYLRTSKTPRGYKPYVQVDFNVGGLRDFRDIERIVNQDDITEESLILSNDLEEQDYEIDDLTPAKLFYNNQSKVVVQTILEEPVGVKVFGKDLNRKIGFSGNDLAIVRYQENLQQKIDTLCELLQGDIPEMPQLGRSKVIGENVSSYSYPELARDVKQVFLQDDLFESVSFSNIQIRQGDIYITLDIVTKYKNAIQRTIKI